MQIPIYQVDAFTALPFRGNPAAVCPLPSWLDDTILQAIAAENNLSETAFMVESTLGYELRWFTPTQEVELCGHATLAAAWVIFHRLGYAADTITFSTRHSGLLIVKKNLDWLEMLFPLRPAKPCAIPMELLRGLNGVTPLEVLLADDYLVIVEDAWTVRHLQPNLHELSQLPARGVIVSARGEDCDFVSRFFAPKYGIAEDPVTGSAHCTLAPYWCERLDKNRLIAKQVSTRSGDIICNVCDGHIQLSGQAVLVMEGVFYYGNGQTS